MLAKSVPTNGDLEETRVVHPDTSLAALDVIIAEFQTFVEEQGAASETDTRIKVIDRILKEICGWPETELSREDHSESGFSDYVLKVRGKGVVVVEAKKESESFRLPKDKTNKTYSLDGVLVTEPPIKEAIYQVQRYCSEYGIRFAVATNGYAWIIFRALREDIPWKKGQSRVFPSLEYIRKNINEFLDLLAYENIDRGSLNEEFSPSIRASRELHRVIDRLFNPDRPLERNRLNSALQPIIKLLFEDIAVQESLDILQNCYIYTGTLTTVANDLDNILTESIPKFLADQGAVPVGTSNSRSGFERVLHNSIIVTKGELFLLLGGIGSGKSTFLRRYLRTTGIKILDEKAMWFVADFLQTPLEISEMEDFVWRAVLTDIRERYKDFECERRKCLHEVFENDISAVESTLLSDMKKGSHKYNETLSPLLFKWQHDLKGYVPRLLRHACIRMGRIPLLFIDNVDQLAPEYQAQIFLLAQRVTRVVGCITVVALREESYYTANVQKTFTAYSSRKFHIASPHFRKMIGFRIEYAIRMIGTTLQDSLDQTRRQQLEDIRDFFVIVKDAMVVNPNIGRFIKSICHGNMRFALEMFATFVTSGAADVDKMLRIFRRDQGMYNIAAHEFVKAIMLGERAFYKEEQSPILNVFNVGAQKNASHFTAWRVLSVLMDHRGESTPEGQGYVDLSKLLFEFEQVFNNEDDFISTINRLVRQHLVETNSRSTESVEGASHVRVTSAGWYYIRYLARTFAYLDLVLQDTPFNDESTVRLLKDSVHQVNNLGDNEDNKLERVRTRFLRVSRFLDYLQSEEDAERKEFGLDQIESPLANKIMNGIRDSFQIEQDRIDYRIRENRERYHEEAGDWNDEESRMMGVIEDPEE